MIKSKTILAGVLTSLCLCFAAHPAFADQQSLTEEAIATANMTTDSIIKQEDNANSWRYENGKPIEQLTEPQRTFKLMSKSATDKTSADAIAQGIDVSEWDGLIDWNTVKASGIDFAIVRCGYGNNQTDQDDKYWKANIAGVKASGLPYGIYIYSYATDTDMARSEALHVIRLMTADSAAPSFPVYYDMEDDDLEGLSASQKADIASTFCSLIAEAGYTPGIYANLNWWNNYLTDPSFESYDRWVAQWNSSCWYTGTYSIWQYSSSGSVPGISTAVDMNYLMENGRKYLEGDEPDPDPTPDPNPTPDPDPEPQYCTDVLGASSSKVFTISKYGAPSAFLDVPGASKNNGASIRIWSRNETPAQHFAVEFTAVDGKNGYYRIRNVNSGKYLAFAKGDLVQTSSADSNDQRWLIQSASEYNGAYNLINMETGQCVDIIGNLSSAGTNAHAYAPNNTSAQAFVFRNCESSLVKSGSTYYMYSGVKLSYALDIPAASKANCASLQVYVSNKTGAQKYKFVYDAKTGYYEISNINSNKMLDAACAGTSNGTNIWQYSQNGTLAQKWSVIDSGNRITLYNACNGLVMDLSCGLAKNCQNVHCWETNGTNAQKWSPVLVK